MCKCSPPRDVCKCKTLKIEVGKTYLNGNGSKVRIVGKHNSGNGLDYIGAYESMSRTPFSIDIREYIETYTEEGFYSCGTRTNKCLVSEYVEPKYTYTNIYKGGIVGCSHSTQESADKFDAGRVSVLRVNIHSGEAEIIPVK